jgi:hypothetical protein
MYSHMHLDLALIHIPLPEYGENNSIVKGGAWKESVTVPTFDSHFCDALAEAGVVAVGCGCDHVNDYCALCPASDNAAYDEESEPQVSYNDNRPVLEP